MFKFNISDVYQAHIDGMKRHFKGLAIFLIICGIIIVLLGALVVLANGTFNVLSITIITVGIVLPPLMYRALFSVFKTNKKYSPHLYTSKHIYSFEKDYFTTYMDDEGRISETRYYYDRIFKVIAYDDYVLIYTSFSNLLIIPYSDLVEGNKADFVPYLNYLLADRIRVTQK